jgi:hypothetical protein
VPTVTKKKSRWIIAAIVLILSVAVLLFFVITTNVTYGSGKSVDTFSTYQDLVEKSPVAVIATVVSDNKEFVYDDIIFAVTEVEVKDCVRGDLGNLTLEILQTKMKEDPYLIKNTEVLLFLRKYKGHVAENVYIINGLHNGQFIIKDNTLHEVRAGYTTAILKTADLESVIGDIKNTEYKE